MAYGKHIIQRQLIELEMSKDIDRVAVQNKVSGIYRQQIMPLLDELLSQVNASSTISIDHLELDIGSISVNELEQVLASRIMIALQEKMDQVIVTSNTELPPIPEAIVPQQLQSHTDAELLSHFLQTGLFPWWAQETTYVYLEKILKAVLRRKDAGFKKILTALLQNEDAVKRLVYTFDDALLEQLVEINTAVDSGEFFKQKETLSSVFTSRLPVQLLRTLWWTALYQTIGNYPGYSAKEMLEKAGWQFIKEAAQQAAWSQLLQWHNQNVGKAEVLESIAEFIRLDDETKAAETQPELDASRKNPVEKGSDEKDSDEKRAVESREETTPDAADSTSKSANPDPVKDDSIPLPEELLSHDFEEPVRNLKLSKGETTVAKNKQPQPVSDIDKIYIENAGLVLLWPFLHRFFQQLELADDKTFLSKENAERACLLLQYLATDSSEMFEAQLLLNKMLCGISLLRPIDTQWRITDKEKAETENLLLSVIEHAGPVWKNLSVAGLRQAYLQRNGILSSRDGSWLLQVERKPYDILIERLPWTVSIVKLPWMKGLVFVEW